MKRILLITLLLAGSAMAQEGEPPDQGGGRWDISLDVPIWPALGDLQPAALGSFDPLGFGLGVSFHWPMRRYANSELLFGFDGNIETTDSNIHGFRNSLSAWQVYLGTSVKWVLGDERNFSFDAGLGYHAVEITEIDTTFWGTAEYKYWGSSRAGAYVGATWDIGAGREDKRSGLFVALRAHFADFGTVHDEDGAAFYRTLGANAGQLDGPMYMVRIGYSAR